MSLSQADLKKVKSLIGQLYKHNELIELLKQVSEIPVVYDTYPIENAPRNKDRNIDTFISFLIDYGYFSKHNSLSKQEINQFLEMLRQSTQVNSNNDNDNANINTNVIPSAESQNQNFPLNQMSQYNEYTTEQLLDMANQRVYTQEPMTVESIQETYNITPNDFGTGSDEALRQDLINDLVKLDRKRFIDTYIPPQTRKRKAGGFGPSAKTGMKELEKIVLDLYRDVTRVKNAISPQGAAKIVEKHNAKAKPESHWRLDKLNPHGPNSLMNMPDVNADGVPDVIIRNAKGNPMYINGYTTKRSDWPETVSYYDNYPTKASRKGITKKQYIDNELYQTQYVDDAENPHNLGLIQYQKPVWYDNIADSKRYKLKNLTKTKMGAFRRFQRYIIMTFFDNALEDHGYNDDDNKCTVKGPLLAKVTGKLWNDKIATPLAIQYNVLPADFEKFKKSTDFKEASDNRVTQIINEIRSNEQNAQEVDQDIHTAMSEALVELGQNPQ